MKQKFALITGGMGGLGESISTKVHAAGFRVVVTHSPGNKGAGKWLADYRTHCFDFAAYEADVADFESCQKCVAAIHAEVGPIDVLVNNAGITKDSTFRKMGYPEWSAVLRTKPVGDGIVERG